MHSIYPIFLNSEPSPLALLNDRITSIMLMMFIWLVRMSEKNHWKICLLLIRYLLAVIHLVVVIQFDLRVMIEWWNNIQIFSHLNLCLLLATHSQVVILSNSEVIVEWWCDIQIFFHLNRYHLLIMHLVSVILSSLEVMIVDELTVRSAKTSVFVCWQLCFWWLSFSSIWEYWLNKKW